MACKRSFLGFGCAVVGFAAAGCGEAPPPPVEPPPAAPAPAAPEPSPAPVASATPAPPSPTPIDGALPPLAPPPLAVRHESTAKACKSLSPLPSEVTAKLSPAAPVAVWEESLGDAGCVTFPKDDGLDVAGMLVAGQAKVEVVGGAAFPVLDTAWTAFAAPGAGVTIHGVAHARLVLVAAATSGEALASRKAGKAWTKRRIEASIAPFGGRPDLAWGKGAYHARIGFDAPPEAAPAVALDTLIFSPDAPVAEHVHDKQWECLVAFEGAGELVVKPAEGAAQANELAPGAVVCIPPNRPHAWAPSGKSRLVALQVYAPPGPEQRFKKLAAPSP